ncbi:hypothetical protein D3C85_1685000 [compost metagenome]
MQHNIANADPIRPANLLLQKTDRKLKRIFFVRAEVNDIWRVHDDFVDTRFLHSCLAFLNV